MKRVGTIQGRSRRLQRIAGLVRTGKTLADVGCDHGYLSIDLVRTGRMRRAIAMDINEGPLQRAAEHIAREALGEYIQTRRSNGLDELSAGEADAVVIAGMGGNLMIDILTRGEALVCALEQLILEPQSELAGVRAYLRERDYRIEAEDLVLEDGKYYPILRVLPKKNSDVSAFSRESGLSESVLDAYGHRLLAARHPALISFLERERHQCEQILAGLLAKQTGSERIALRRAQLLEKMERNRAAAAYINRKAGEH